MPTVELAFVALDKIIVDASYQRELNMDRACRIAENWSDEKAGAITLSRRADDIYAVIDGQHRLVAARLRQKDELPAVISIGQTEQQEAGNFWATNAARRPLTTKQLFKASLAAGDPAAIDISGVLRANGVGSEFRAYAAIRRAYDKHGKLWIDALLVIATRVWPEIKSLDGNIILGFMTLQGYANYESKVFDWDRVARVFATHSQQEIVRHYNSIASSASKQLASASVLLAMYNKAPGTHASRLPQPPTLQMLGTRAALNKAPMTRAERWEQTKSRKDQAYKKEGTVPLRIRPMVDDAITYTSESG